MYYHKNSEKIKKNASDNYYKNHEKRLKQRKLSREKQQFDSKREKILKRDNYTCCMCNKKLGPRFLIVHHKDRKGRGSKIKNNDDDNLITLCRSCHIKEHNKDLKKALLEKYTGKWSIKYDKCIMCGTTSVKYQGKGMCANCYAKESRKKKNQSVVKYDWSRKYSCCVVCGTIKTPHEAKGMCKICYEKNRSKRNKNNKTGEDIV